MKNWKEKKVAILATDGVEEAGLKTPMEALGVPVINKAAKSKAHWHKRRHA